MPSIELRTDVLAPKHFKTYNFSGYHPTRFLKVAPNLIKDVFQITEPNTFEDVLKWDRSSDPIEFYALWRGKDSKDNKSTFWVTVKAMGVQKAKDKMGKITIFVSATLDTNFPYSNSLEKALITAYAYMYYHKIRRRYIMEQKRNMDEFDLEIKKILGAMEG